MDVEYICREVRILANGARAFVRESKRETESEAPRCKLTKAGLSVSERIARQLRRDGERRQKTNLRGRAGRSFDADQIAKYERDSTFTPASLIKSPTSAQATVIRGYREAFADLIVTFEPTHFVSLVFNRDTTLAGAEQKLREFHKRICRKLVKRDWCKSEKAHLLPEYIAVAEHPDSNIHLHAAYRLDPKYHEQFAGEAEAIWLRLVESGSVDVKAATNTAGLAAYLAKEITAYTNDQIFISGTHR